MWSESSSTGKRRRHRLSYEAMSGPLETTIGKCELQILLDRRVELERRGHKIRKQLRVKEGCCRNVMCYEKI
jgi:hypothetical protein